MALGISVKVNAVNLGRKLDTLARPFRARTPLLEAIGRAGVEWVRENFARRGNLRQPGGWRRLRPNTIAAKGHDQILVDSGDLALSFRYTVFGGSVRVRSDNPLAKFHQFGTKGPYDIPRNPPMPPGRYLVFMTASGLRFAKAVKHPGLPARPMLPTVNQFREIAREVANDYVKEATNAAR